MRRHALLGALVAASAIGLARAAEPEQGEPTPAEPLLDPKPLPPSTMTRQQRRANEREDRKDPHRWRTA